MLHLHRDLPLTIISERTPTLETSFTLAMSVQCFLYDIALTRDIFSYLTRPVGKISRIYSELLATSFAQTSTSAQMVVLKVPELLYMKLQKTHSKLSVSSFACTFP